MLLAPIVLAWASLSIITIVAASRKLRTVAVTAIDGAFSETIRRAGVTRIACLDLAAPAAFCAGAIRPTVYVTRGLFQVLPADEATAVLVHEQDHLIGHEPLLRVILDALGRTLFFLPIVAWWAERQSQLAELRADRAAIEQVGAMPLARALLALDASGPFASLTAFAGTTGLRIAQVLGESTASPRPSRRIIAASATGLCLAIAAGFCLTSLLQTPVFPGP